MATNLPGCTCLLFVLKRTPPPPSTSTTSPPTESSFLVLRRLSISPDYDPQGKPLPFHEIDEEMRQGVVKLVDKYNNFEPDPAKHVWGVKKLYTAPRDGCVMVILDHLPSVRGVMAGQSQMGGVGGGRNWPKPTILSYYSLTARSGTSTPIFKFAYQITLSPGYIPGGHVVPFTAIGQDMYLLIQERIERVCRLGDDPLRRPWGLRSVTRTTSFATGSLMLFLEYQPNSALEDPMTPMARSPASSAGFIHVNRHGQELEGSYISETLPPSYTTVQAQVETVL